MRSAFVPHLNQLVLGKGWIDSWEDFKSTQTRRVCVKQPTIKIADKHTLFANQQVVSTEHHINLFIPYNLLEQYQAHFITHSPFSFSGVVVEYQRKNGSMDFGITATPQQRIQLDLDRLSLAVVDIARANPYAPSTLAFYERTALPQLFALEERLEQVGNALPTFDKTYEDYKKLILDMRVAISNAIEHIEFRTSSRAFRRCQKARSNFLELVPSVKHFRC